MAAETVSLGLIKWVGGVFVAIVTSVVGWMVSEMTSMRKRINKLETEAVTEEKVEKIVSTACDPLQESSERIEESLKEIASAIEGLKIKTAVLEDRNERA